MRTVGSRRTRSATLADGSLEIGLRLGSKVLSAEKLADCFDDVCARGRCHDADALEK
jgi:hypothetical protein